MYTVNKTDMVRPFIKWAGGKRRTLNQLLFFMPDRISSFVEPFVGSGCVYFALNAPKSIINDSNEELINTYIQIRDNLDELKTLLRSYPYDKDFFLKIRALDRDPDFLSLPKVQRAARFIYLIKTCFNGLYRVNSKNYFNTPFGKYTDPKICDDEVLDAAHNYMHKNKTDIRCGHFYDLLDDIDSDAFVYLDPPYFPIAEKSFTSYQPNQWTEENDYELFEFCKELDKRGIRFMLSNSTAPFIIDLYKNFEMEMINATRSINASGSTRGQIKEIIITNYDLSGRIKKNRKKKIKD
ncbi:Dam family site-specific DNA-(adenine-N6)-methyltransferase [Succinatimonas hippei]|uniref:DNA adenine methylase n=1 Tax=Succinatimonas hippei TaxID=626938 RepID=UPI0026F1E6D8|nr:Dam family site-specific DNA-(adenine-N6)-methyltransferase [Succinatimonas hippei]